MKMKKNEMHSLEIMFDVELKFNFNIKKGE